MISRTILMSKYCSKTTQPALYKLIVHTKLMAEFVQESLIPHLVINYSNKPFTCTTESLFYNVLAQS